MKMVVMVSSTNDHRKEINKSVMEMISSNKLYYDDFVFIIEKGDLEDVEWMLELIYRVLIELVDMDINEVIESIKAKDFKTIYCKLRHERRNAKRIYYMYIFLYFMFYINQKRGLDLRDEIISMILYYIGKTALEVNNNTQEYYIKRSEDIFNRITGINLEEYKNGDELLKVMKEKNMQITIGKDPCGLKEHET